MNLSDTPFAEIHSCNQKVIDKLESENKRLREALEKIKDKENWGYLDESGCPKGYGMYTESWVKDGHPIELAKAALEGKAE